MDHRKEEDRAAVLAILREYFAPMGDEDADRRYAWLYLDNPHGLARTYLACALDDGAPVGITSLFPRAVQVGGRRVYGAIGGDAYVTPAFRRRGIVTALHKLALAALDDRCSFMFGPPEPNNLKALLQAGSVITGAVRRYTRPFTAKGLGGGAARIRELLRAPIGFALRPPRSSSCLVALGGEPDARVDDVWRATLAASTDGRRVLPVRDAAFYAWRFGRCVSQKQRGFLVLDGETPIGAVALEEKNNRFGIVDVTCPPSALRSVVRAAMASNAHADAMEIQIHVPSRATEIALTTLGFVPRAKKSFQVQAGENHPDRAILRRPDAWHYMWGDGDVDHVL